VEAGSNPRQAELDLCQLLDDCCCVSCLEASWESCWRLHSLLKELGLQKEKKNLLDFAIVIGIGGYLLVGLVELSEPDESASLANENVGFVRDVDHYS
jgi:hypothetical protein